MVRDNLEGASGGVLSQMPEKIRRKCKRDAPKTSLTTLEDLEGMPDNLRSTLTGESF